MLNSFSVGADEAGKYSGVLVKSEYIEYEYMTHYMSMST